MAHGTLRLWSLTVCKAWLCGRVCERKGGSDRSWHLGTGQREKQYCSCFQNISVWLSITDLSLVLLLLPQTSAFQAFAVAAFLFCPREEIQELIEFCKVNEIFQSTCETMCQVVVLNGAGVPVPGKLVSALRICHITYRPTFHFLTHGGGERTVFSLGNSVWQVPASMAWRLILWTGTADVKHLGLKRPLSAGPVKVILYRKESGRAQLTSSILGRNVT